MDYYTSAFKNFAKFSGRATRSEYWYFVLFSFIISVGLSLLGFFVGSIMAKIAGLYGLIIIIPSLALSVRRLHDTNRSGWWILINFIPLIGALVYLFFMIQASVSENNIYGDESQIPAPQLTQ